VSITAAGPESLALEIALPAVEEAVPAQRSTLLKSGRISYRNRPKRDVIDLHARVVASLPILHGALALDAAPTLQAVLVSGTRDAVDPASGLDGEECLVSVLLDREALSALKLDRVDPVVVLENFEARFRPTVTLGLKPVEPLTAEALLAADAEPVAPEPAPPRRSGRVAAASREEVPAASAPVEREVPPQAAAEDALRLAMACARADGQVVAVELAAVDRLVARFAASPAQLKRLRLLRESLVADRIDVEAAALRLRTGLSADKRRLLLEELAAVAAADEAMPEPEVALLERVAAALDVSAAPVAEAQARLRAAAEAPARERLGHLAALELPPDADPDVGVLDRALASIRDRYAPERLADLAEEIRALGATRRERAEAAHAALLAALPPERRVAAPVYAAAASEPRRANQDLDAIFG
jgi:uncharacterized tellurite resistance protein B-like protein